MKIANTIRNISISLDGHRRLLMAKRRAMIAAMTLLGVGAVLLAPDVAMAAGTEFGADNIGGISTLCSLAKLLSGTVARIVAVIAVVISGITFAIGEGNGLFKTMLGIVFGVGFAVGAFQVISAITGGQAIPGCGV